MSPMKRAVTRAVLLCSMSALLVAIGVSAQRPANAPAPGSHDSGVSRDPAMATADIGKMGVEFKANAGIAQCNPLKKPSQGRGRREGL